MSSSPTRTGSASARGLRRRFRGDETARLRLDGPELVIVLAACMGISALSIDLLLPAFADMRADFGLAAGSTRISLIITAYFLGLGFGQILYGPASDRFGRKPAMYTGLALYVAATTASVFASSLMVLIVFRFLWGLGAAAPRSLALAVARDVYTGDRLARTMSLIMSIYILVPVFAPGLGTVLLSVSSWRVIVVVQLLIGVGIAAWLPRLPETLAPEHRRSVSVRSLADAAGAVLRCRPTIGYGLGVTCVYAIMISYIGSIELLIDEVLGHGDRFAVLFSIVALGLVAGSFSASRLVGRFGSHRLIAGAVTLLVAATALLAIVSHLNGGHPNTVLFLGVTTIVLFASTLIVPTANAAALEPLGHVAGMAAAIVGVASTAGAALLGSLTDRAYDGTAGPFGVHALVYALLGAAAVFLISGPVVGRRRVQR